MSITGSIIVSPSVLDLRGSNVMLSWVSPLAVSAVIDNGIGAVANPTSGSIMAFALFPTTYHITFTDANQNSFVASASVSVNPDVMTTSPGLNIRTQVVRELAAGGAATNLTRPTGDGMPSYIIRDALIPGVPAVAQVVYMIGLTTNQNPSISAVDVSDKTTPLLVANVNTLTEVTFDEFPGQANDWLRVRRLFVDQNYIYYYANASGSLVVRQADTNTMAVVGKSAGTGVGVFQVIQYQATKFLAFGINGFPETPQLFTFDASNVASITSTNSFFSAGTRTMSAGGMGGACIVNGKAYISGLGYMDQLSSINPYGSWSSFVMQNDDGSAWYRNIGSCAAYGNYLYRFAEDGAHSNQFFIQIVNTQTNTEILPSGGRIYETLIATPDDRLCCQIYVVGAYLYEFVFYSTVSSNYNLRVFSLADPTNPVLVGNGNIGTGQWNLQGLAIAGGATPVYFNGLHVHVSYDGRYFYVLTRNDDALATFRRILFILDNNDPSNLVLTNPKHTVSWDNQWNEQPDVAGMGCFPNGFITDGQVSVPA